jgi:uncharacterized membrane protein
MLVDVGFYEKSSYWNVTPGVNVVTVSAGLFSIIIGLLLKKLLGMRYWIFPVLFGFGLASYTSYNLLLFLQYPIRILYPIGPALAFTLIIYYLSGFFKKTLIFRQKENAAIIFAHMLDGFATFIGINYYNFNEEHILPERLIELAGTALVMIPMKIVVILPILYLIEKWHEEEKDSSKVILQYYILKYVIFFLGFGPGIRDALLPALIG